MRRRFAIPLLIAFSSLAWGASSHAEIEQTGNLRVSFDANFAPHVLPRDRAAPVKVEIEGKVVTTDGSHPPPLRWLEVALHRNGQLFTKGLPVCLPAALQSTNSAIALARCRPALVGRGRFRAEVLLGRKVVASGRILIFNSRRAGRRALVLHLHTGVPIQLTLVVPMSIAHRAQGEFGTVLRARIPKLGGDLGSVTQISMAIQRRFSFAGKRRSYVSAACSAPAGLTFALFDFARASLRFAGNREVETTLIRDCSVR